MAEPKARLGLEEVTASIRRMRVEGERLVSRIRREAGALTSRSRREAVSGLIADARKLQGDLRKRAERVVQDLEKRRARILASLEEQVTHLVELVVKRLNVASQDDVSKLRSRVVDLERRLESIVKENAKEKERAA
jgi:polyhydroxyalkanoate synthesis regulator phasin